jgi:hypothetical protein
MSEPNKRGINMNEIEKSNVIDPEVNHEILTPYEIGKKFGRCGTQVLFNLPFNEEDDISIPETIRNDLETKRGIRDGVKEIYDMLSQLDKQMTTKEE